MSPGDRVSAMSRSICDGGGGVAGAKDGRLVVFPKFHSRQWQSRLPPAAGGSSFPNVLLGQIWNGRGVLCCYGGAMYVLFSCLLWLTTTQVISEAVSEMLRILTTWTGDFSLFRAVSRTATWRTSTSHLPAFLPFLCPSLCLHLAEGIQSPLAWVKETHLFLFTRIGIFLAEKSS